MCIRDRAHTEYEYNGSKYIRFVGDSNCDGEVLSDGRTIQSGINVPGGHCHGFPDPDFRHYEYVGEPDCFL